MRGQFRGYRKETGVAADSTGGDLRGAAAGDRFVALAGRAVLHPRRQVPAGDVHGGRSSACADRRRCFKASTCKPNHCRFRISPEVDACDRHECHGPGRGDRRQPIGDARRAATPAPTRWTPTSACWATRWPATPRLFAREDYVEEAWRIVDPVLKAGTPVYEYEPKTWGPTEVEQKS